MDDLLVGVACVALPVVGILATVGLVRLLSGNRDSSGSQVRIDSLQVEIDALKRQTWALHSRLGEVEQALKEARSRGALAAAAGHALRAEHPPTEEPSAHTPGAEEPSAEGPSAHTPSAEGPSTEEPSAHETPTEEPSAHEAAAEAPSAAETPAGTPAETPAETPAGPAPEAPPEAPPEATEEPEASAGLEQWIGVRGAAALGGVVLVIAGLYFFQYSIEHGWLTPLMRVVLGVVVGAGLLLGSELRLRRTHVVLANWLDGAGIAILYTAFWAGSALYSLYPTLLAAAMMIVVTGLCCALSLLREATPIAFLGLVGGFLTPMALSTGEDRPYALFGYLLVLDTAMLVIARRKRWPALAALSLGGTALYQAIWIFGAMGEDRFLLGTILLGLFAALFAALPILVPTEGEAPKEGEEEGFTLEALTRMGALAVPAIFLFTFSVKGALADHWLSTGLLIASLNLGALVLARVTKDGRLPLLAAIASVAVFAAGAQREALPGVAAWGALGVAVGIAALHHAAFELADLYTEARFRASANLLCLGMTGVAVLCVQHGHRVPLPELLAASALALLFARQGLRTAAFRAEAEIARAKIEATEAKEGTEAKEPREPLPPLGDDGAYAGLIAPLLPFAVLGLASLTRYPDLPFGPVPLTDGLPLLYVGLALAWTFHPGLSEALRKSAGAGAAAASLAALLLLSVVLPSHEAWAITWAGLLLGAIALSLLAAARSGSAVWALPTVLLGALGVGLYDVAYLDEAPRAALLLGLGALLFFLAFPFATRALSPSTYDRDRWAFRVPALAGLFLALPLYSAYVEGLGRSTIGLLPLGVGVLLLLLAAAVHRLAPADFEVEKSAMVWLAGAACALITAAVPLQLEREWITVAWALEALALMMIYRRIDHPGLKVVALLLAAAVTIRLVANPYVLEYYPRGSMRILNWISYTYVLPALALLGAQWALAGVEEAREAAKPEPARSSAGGLPRGWLSTSLGAMAAVILFVWLNLIILDWYAREPMLSIPYDREPARDLSLSMGWAVYALGLLAVGMWRDSLPPRIASLVLLLVTSAKIFLYDLSHLRDLYLVAALFGLALSLITVSAAYQRFVFRKKGSAAKPDTKPESKPESEPESKPAAEPDGGSGA